MNPEQPRPDLATEYQNLLNMLARTGKYLEGLNADPSLLKSYRRLLSVFTISTSGKNPRDTRRELSQE